MTELLITRTTSFTRYAKDEIINSFKGIFMKKSELNLAVLKDSYNPLKECYSDYAAQNDLKMKEYIKDSCIKRFEYTYKK